MDLVYGMLLSTHDGENVMHDLLVDQRKRDDADEDEKIEGRKKESN